LGEKYDRIAVGEASCSGIAGSVAWPAFAGRRDVGQFVYREGGEWPVHDDGVYVFAMVNGMPVVAAPAEMDITTTEQLRAILLDASHSKHPVIVLDLSRTQFCDSAAIQTVLRAHERLVAEGRELRLVVPQDGAVPRLLVLTGIVSRLPCFASTERAVSLPPGASAPSRGASGPEAN
jgi:anti-sigma B factor antagonist